MNVMSCTIFSRSSQIKLGKNMSNYCTSSRLQWGANVALFPLDTGVKTTNNIHIREKQSGKKRAQLLLPTRYIARTLFIHFYL